MSELPIAHNGDELGEGTLDEVQRDVLLRELFMTYMRVLRENNVSEEEIEQAYQLWKKGEHK